MKGYALKICDGHQQPAVRPPEYVIEKDGKEMVRGTPVTLIFFAFMRMEEMSAQLEEAFKQINQLREDAKRDREDIQHLSQNSANDLANIERDIARNYD